MSKYRIFGVELSPYSMKVLSYFRYKGIEHEWIVRTPRVQAEFEKYAKLPLIPVVVFPDDTAMQDSTPILHALEQRHPEPATVPDDPVLAFVDALLEEYADEWLNKAMFHYRWTYPENQRSASRRIARVQLIGSRFGETPVLRNLMARMVARRVRARMIPRLFFVGSSRQTARQIEGSFVRLCALLEVHFNSGRPYLFGARPSQADFSLWGQFQTIITDPGPGRIICNGHPCLSAWIERMPSARSEGEWEKPEALLITLRPILQLEIAGLFLPWSTANAAAIADSRESFSVTLQGLEFAQKPQKYHARSLAALCEQYAKVADRPELDELMRQVGARPYLSR
ncbi:MAG: glutathione S-transferase [Gammaproteobacteria bacterium AqS3]|nr:glutathione S-transferase [Gammaproteobacteria bacterium AqS3]